MPAQNVIVVRSINNAEVVRCVDIFRRRDGSYGFGEYRRDAEDLQGWFPVGGDRQGRFESEQAALAAAVQATPWLVEFI